MVETEAGGAKGNVVAEASAGENVNSVTWLSRDTLLVGSRGNTELQIWKLHPHLGDPPLPTASQPQWLALS